MIFIRGNPLDYEKWAKDPEWKHGIMRIAFLILKSLKTEPLGKLLAWGMVRCTSRPGLHQPFVQSIF
jgi:hypothetical protein